MSSVYVVDEWFIDGCGEKNESVVGVFTTKKLALEAIRALKGQPVYNGEYNEFLYPDFPIDECVYGETDNYVETHFILTPCKINKFFPTGVKI